MVLKNVQFSKLIKAEGRLREFNFRKSNGIIGPVYHVDVSDDGETGIILTCI